MAAIMRRLAWKVYGEIAILPTTGMKNKVCSVQCTVLVGIMDCKGNALSDRMFNCHCGHAYGSQEPC